MDRPELTLCENPILATPDGPPGDDYDGKAIPTLLVWMSPEAFSVLDGPATESGRHNMRPQSPDEPAEEWKAS